MSLEDGEESDLPNYSLRLLPVSETLPNFFTAGPDERIGRQDMKLSSLAFLRTR